VSDVGRLRKGFWSRGGYTAVLVTELRRAIAAEHRYEELKRLDAVAGKRGSRADIARLVFEEFYASGGAGAAAL
jgi:hypothetical protein